MFAVRLVRWTPRTAATVGRLLPFSLQRLGPSGEWLCSGLGIELEDILLAQRDTQSQDSTYIKTQKEQQSVRRQFKQVATQPIDYGRLKNNDQNVTPLPQHQSQRGKRSVWASLYSPRVNTMVLTCAW